MKTINKMMLLMFAALALSNTTSNCFFYGGDGYGNNTLSGAAIGGLAGGRKGAAIGLGVGAGIDMMGAASRDDRRRRNDNYRDDNYYDRDDRPSRRSRKSRYRASEDEIAALRARLEECENRY